MGCCCCCLDRFDALRHQRPEQRSHQRCQRAARNCESRNLVSRRHANPPFYIDKSQISLPHDGNVLVHWRSMKTCKRRSTSVWLGVWSANRWIIFARFSCRTLVARLSQKAFHSAFNPKTGWRSDGKARIA